MHVIVLATRLRIGEGSVLQADPVRRPVAVALIRSVRVADRGASAIVVGGQGKKIVVSLAKSKKLARSEISYGL